MASSTTLQLDKSSWPSQILLVCRLGKGWTTQETQTLPAPNHTPYGTNTPTLLLYAPVVLHLWCTIASSSRALADILEDEYVAWEGGSAWTPEEASLLQDRPFSATASVYISSEAWETQNHQTFSSISLLGTLGPGDRKLMILVLVSFTLIYSCSIIPLWDTLRSTFLCLHLKRASRLTFSYWVHEHQGTGGLSVSNLCLCQSHLSTHIVSCISIVILH